MPAKGLLLAVVSCGSAARRRNVDGRPAQEAGHGCAPGELRQADSCLARRESPRGSASPPSLRRTKTVKGGWYSICRYHAATDTGTSPAISLAVYPMTPAKRTAFQKGLVSVAALAAKRVPRATAPARLRRPGGRTGDRSERLHRHASLRSGQRSFEFGSAGLVFGTPKYYVNDVSIHGDEAQEALMRAVTAKLH